MSLRNKRKSSEDVSEDRAVGPTVDLLAGGDFLHAIQSASGLEPGDLEVIEAVVQLDLLLLAVGVFDLSGQRFAGREAVQAKN